MITARVLLAPFLLFSIVIIVFTIISKFLHSILHPTPRGRDSIAPYLMGIPSPTHSGLFSYTSSPFSRPHSTAVPLSGLFFLSPLIFTFLIRCCSSFYHSFPLLTYSACFFLSALFPFHLPTLSFFSLSLTLPVFSSLSPFRVFFFLLSLFIQFPLLFLLPFPLPSHPFPPPFTQTPPLTLLPILPLPLNPSPPL